MNSCVPIQVCTFLAKKKKYSDSFTARIKLIFWGNIQEVKQTVTHLKDKVSILAAYRDVMLQHIFHLETMHAQ